MNHRRAWAIARKEFLHVLRDPRSLGLAIASNILQNHGGDIWYEPKCDGSNFVVALPQ